MDMEVDIPNPDELEWLEANSHLYEEPPDPFLEPQSPPLSPPSPPTADSPTTNGHKRSRFQNPPNQQDAAVQSNEKRSKINDSLPPPQEEDDEDWLRYSPPPDPPQQEDRCCAGEATNVESVAEEEEEEEERILSRYASEIDGDFIPVTAPSGGDRVYAKICRLEKEQRSKKLDTKLLSNGLIAEPINVLMQKVEHEAFTKALKASSEVQSDVVLPETPVVREQLWVDKYAPSSFTELLSDEQTNREVLLWLKQWDSCGFGSEVRSTSDEVLSALRRHSSVSHHPKPTVSNFSRKDSRHRFGNGRLRYPDSTNHENSESKVIKDLWSKKSRFTGPPEQKILLLCGPPGLGKTTLAHVAAKHCGYRVVEVNASDDRSSSTIEAKILDVVQMNSVTVDSRPKCLVIDEIDGTLGEGKGAVDVILKMVSSDRKADTGKENVLKGDQSGRVSSKRGHKNASLSRPVICICNDLYAPVLRPLRQVAKVHIFVRPTVSRVVSRLKYICHKEGMQTSSIVLTALAEYTESDIRSCLNTLQFLNKKKETLNMDPESVAYDGKTVKAIGITPDTLEIGTQVVGRKDMSRSAFDVWKEIFQQRKMKRDRKSAGNFGSRSNESDCLHTLISHRGDYDVILDGIHENILHLGYHDPLMQKTVKCFNSIGISDLMHRFIMRTQQMSLHAYQPFLAISVHRCIAQVQKPTIEWPKSYQRYRTTLMEKMDILMSWQNKILPHISRHLSPKSFVVDSVSPLLHILSPSTLRPVALHLLSEKEKIDLAQLVNTMVSYSVTYKNIKSDPPSSNQQHEAALDASAFSFDPPISDFINFKGYNSAHYVLPTAMKQVLVHEVEMQKILQVSKCPILVDGCKKENLHLVGRENNEIGPAKTDLAAAFSANKGMKKSLSTARQSTPNTSTTLSALESGKSKSSVNSKKPLGGSINFFDRFRKASGKGSPNADNAVEKTTLSERDSRPLLFKFNEGFTNAVKRPVRMREFLQ